MHTTEPFMWGQTQLEGESTKHIELTCLQTLYLREGRLRCVSVTVGTMKIIRVNLIRLHEGLFLLYYLEINGKSC